MQNPFTSTFTTQEFQNLLDQTVAGVWTGNGIDTFPNPSGGPPIQTSYTETMNVESSFITTNQGNPGNNQELLCMRYFTKLLNSETKAPMHQETGFWLFDCASRIFMKSIAIPRGISILTNGLHMVFGPPLERYLLMVSMAESGAQCYGVLSDVFLQGVAPTTSFKNVTTINKNGLNYMEISVLMIEGTPCNHVDEASLKRG